MIFQTFDDGIDNTLHKIGVLGNSFGEIINTIAKRKQDIKELADNKGINESEAKKQVGSLWSYLNPKKEMSPELLDQAKQFQEIFNTTQLSASAVAEQMGKVDDSIIRCASSMKNGEFTLKAYTQSVQGLTFAAKAGKVALQLLASAGSMIAGILIGEAISGVIKLIDNQIHAAEKAQEAMEDSMAAYEKSKEELKNVNKELESNEKRIDELLAKDYLTYTEESELQRLKDVNEQLLIQRALLDEITENGLTQTIEKAVDGYNEKYKNGPVTNEDIDRYKRSVDGGMPLNELLVDENNIAKQIAAYEKLIEYRVFNSTQLSASAVAEQLGEVDDSIIRCASNMKNGEFTIKAYTKSIQGLTFAAKAGKVALQLLASAGSMIAGILIGEAISGVIKLIDNQIHAAEKAQEAAEEAIAAYEKSKAELENVNKELKTNEKLIDELLAKDVLTYAEESELQRLKDVNEQLLIQKALLDEITENELTQTIEKTVDAYNKKYKEGPVTNEDIDRYKRSVDGGMPLNELLVDENNIAKQIAAYEKLIEYRDKAFSSGDNKLAEKYSRQITDVNEHILTSLQEDQSKIKNLSLKPFDDLTSEAQEAFKGLSSSFEVAYKRFDPSTWNKIQLDDLFKTKEFDETKDKLSELSKAGKLTVESLSEEFPELAQAISNLDLVTSDGVSKLQSVVNQFNSESEKLKDSNVSSDPIGFDISNEETSKAIDEFQKKLSTLGSALENLKSRKEKLKDSNVSSDPIGFDISNEETSKAIDEFQKKLSTLGSALENLKSRKLTSSDILDLQQEFPELANETDNLDKALTDLVDNTLSNLVTYLKDAGASNELINTFRELANEAKGISTPDWSGTLSVFDTAESKMQTLAEIVDALGKSYTLTAEEARKFAEVFPDLLQKGQVTSDGLIQFNKSVIDDFINGKQIQINADRETQISQLESEKTLLEGKRAAAQAALDLIAAQASGEVDGENQKNEKIAEARDRLVQHLVDLGVEEQNADAVAKELMAGNMSEYDRVVSEVSANIDSNLTNSIDDASKNVNTQAGNLIDSLFKVGQQALNTAKSILSIGSENPVDTVKETLNGVGDSIKNFSPKDAASNFVKSVQDAINVNKYDSVDASVKLELDISNYTSAINELDSQINLLKSAGNKNVDDYVKDLRDKSEKGWRFN